MSEWARLPGEPDDYWQCVECELIILIGGNRTQTATCPECGATMVHVSDEVPEGWERWEATIEAVREESGKAVRIVPLTHKGLGEAP